jgi:DNA topoisomerase I
MTQLKVAAPSARTLARKLDLKMVRPDALVWTRKRSGRGFVYFGKTGRRIRDKAIVARLNALAVPPAYAEVNYAADPRAHLQATGRDAAGRLQYRYHPDWEKVREERKAHRLAQFVEALPRIRRHVRRCLSDANCSREFALAAVIELVASSSIRAGSEEYAKQHRTRGAATLLKSNLKVIDGKMSLSFRAKGGKHVQREVVSAPLAAAIEVLQALPGKRLFQYRDDAADVRTIRARDVNAHLQEIAGTAITLKDFRTLCASAAVLEELAKTEPASSVSARKKQVLEAVRSAADELTNTVAVCRKSYVHQAVVDAFESGVLEDYADALKSARSPAKREQVLADVIASRS